MLIVDTVRKWKKYIGQRPYPAIVCLDHNGVSDQYSGWRGLYELFDPAENVIWFYNELLRRKVQLVVLTAFPDLKLLSQWYDKHKFVRYFSAITYFKIPAIRYIDDRALLHNGDFEDTIRRYDEFVKCHWETDEVIKKTVDFAPVSHTDTEIITKLDKKDYQVSRYKHTCKDGTIRYLSITTVQKTDSGDYIRLAYCLGCKSYPLVESI